nr:MAG TPA: hypothetical protein [Caudoviricetes sp.]
MSTTIPTVGGKHHSRSGQSIPRHLQEGGERCAGH